MMNVSVNFTDEENNLSVSLEHGYAAEIIHLVKDIYSILIKASVPVRPYTRKAVQTLLASDEAKQLRIIHDLKNWKAILVSSEVGLGNVDECHLAQKALNHLNFRLKDQNWQDACFDQIIEIYSPNGIQLYRSLNFFNTCGYSLLDLCVNEWYVLWERPTSVINRIHEVVNAVMTGQKQDTDVGIGSHLIRETYDDGTTQPFLPRTALVEFGKIYPAYCGADKKAIIGFVITSRGKVVSVGSETDAIDFI